MHNLHDIANSPIVITLLGGITIALLRYIFVGKLHVAFRILLFLLVASLVVFWVSVALPGSKKDATPIKDTQSNEEVSSAVATENNSSESVSQVRSNSKLRLSVGALNFGTSLNSVSFSIVNAGTSGTIAWSISDKPGWLTVTPSSGILEAGKKTELSANISRAMIPASVSDVIRITANGEVHTLEAKVEVLSTENSVSNNEVGLNTGLMVWYTFDDGSAEDASGSRHNGNLTGTPSFGSDTPSGSGKSLYLRKNKKQYVAIPHNPFRGQSSYAVSMWVKDFGQGVLFSAVSNDGLRSDFPRLIAGTDSKFTFYTGYDEDNTTTPFTYNYSVLQDGKWHHIVVVCKEAGEGRYLKELYVDRVLMDTAEADTTPSEYEECFKVYLGGDSDGRYSFTNNIKLDNVRMYAKSIGPREVRAIYSLEK